MLCCKLLVLSYFGEKNIFSSLLYFVPKGEKGTVTLTDRADHLGIFKQMLGYITNEVMS